MDEIIGFLSKHEWHEYVSLGMCLVVILMGLFFARKEKAEIIKAARFGMVLFGALLFIALLLFKFVGVTFEHIDVTYACLLVPVGLFGFIIFLYALGESMKSVL